LLALRTSSNISISKNGFSHVTFFYPLGGERKGKDDLKCGDWIN
jgi:hypothetical protein